MKLIDDWRDAWRLWSVRLVAVGALLQALAMASPDTLLVAWNALPSDLRIVLPEGAEGYISLGLYLAAIVARVLKQPTRPDRSIAADTSGRVRAKPAGIAGLTGAMAIALALAVTALKPDEGKVNVSYLDIAAIPTSCYGHTGPEVRVGERKTDAECEQLLNTDAEKHLRGVLACTPALAERPQQLAAATRLAFNIGVSAYCGSTVARKFNTGDLRGGCDAFLPWNKARVRGQLIVVRGLADRRERERAMCRQGLA